MEAIDCSAMARETPHFVKVYFPGSDHLKIPPAFRGCIEHESPGTVSLKGPGGHTWTVELVKSEKGLLFESGWKEFVADHSIMPGDFLVFRYEGRLHFSVLIFDTTACEKKTAFLVRPYRERITIVNGSEGGEEGKALEEHIAKGGEEGKALEEDVTIVEGKALEKHITIIVIGSESDEEGKALEEHDSKALVLSPSRSSGVGRKRTRRSIGSGVGRKRTRRSTGCLEIEDPPLKKEKNKVLEEHDSKVLVLSPSGSSGVGRKRTRRSTGCLEIEDAPLKKEKNKALEEHDSKALVLSPGGSSGVGRKRTRRSTSSFL